jgi:hypothetical protein
LAPAVDEQGEQERMSSTLRVVSKGGHREKRRDKRRLQPTLVISIDNATYVTTDWSLGGVLLSDYHGPRLRGEEIEAQVRVATEPDKYPFKATIVRRREGRMALHFTELSDGAFALLEDLSTGRQRRARAQRRRPSAD